MRIHLISPNGKASASVEVSPDIFRLNPVRPGQNVWVAPRRGRVFEPEYSI